jgi:chromosome segregation ATPase
VPTPEAAKVAESINEIVRQTRTPFGEPRKLEQSQVAELETSLRNLEAQLLAHEQANLALQGQLAERERELWEMEALLKAREELLRVERKRVTATPFASATGSAALAEEVKACETLKAELDAQEESLKQAKEQLHEREQFLAEAESHVAAKMAELDQREADLHEREQKFRREAGLPPPEAKP